MARRRSIIVLWLYLLLLKVKSDSAANVNMDTSALFKIDKDEVDVSEKDFHVGDLAIDDNLLVDDLSNIVLTVGELVEMYNNDETINKNNSPVGKKKFETIEKNKIVKQSSSDITVDFRDVAGMLEQI